MTEIIVDTDVVSFLFKGHELRHLYDIHLAGRVPMLSFMSVAELERWARQYAWSPDRVDRLRLYIQRFTVVPSTEDLCRKWAEVMVTCQAAGRRIDTADAWIAATALLYEAPLLTHNRRHYMGVPGLRVISHSS